ncbi:serine/threonine protein kinase [Frankia sp. CNm7]|uniref:Serine/threonine protein kinase n=1 Tax=Frankia nepalensis TaxID=1836974 RepID=A0A937R9E2_9ACTN|nr:serine/threonine-protein kinase [Frankia nepalensis]MBL7497982.1 serine/threonine protein kinase [Frankia nepalensis]MBL7509063.1 serine/threonine protein kinase [Frankia nepalensis]MBL7516834.1 serine/threonine protein kinase [Frankia nepalensis]MBL7627831.1 serine/threonine protein kinase [Frankia nepalensis]
MIVDQTQLAAALPGYTLGDEIGAGSFGLVVAGWHRRLQRDVAIKVVSAGWRSPGQARPVAAEGRILASLDHPHIVRVYDHVESGDLHLIVMEMLAGGTLTRRTPRLGHREACAVGLAVADALSAEHDRGVLHRDIKPDNVLFDGAGLPKVVDFGIAKLIRGSAATASRVFGTPMFMAPEQFLAGRLGPYTDLYALGVMLYLLMAGHVPFEDADVGPAGTSAGPLPSRYRDRHLLGDRPPAPVGVPDAVADVIPRSLDRNPDRRPPSARAFALDLARAAAASCGPGWLAESGIPVRLADEVRAAAERPSALAGPATGTLILPPPAGAALAPDPTITYPRAARLDGDMDPELEESSTGPTAGPPAQTAPLDDADGHPPASDDLQGPRGGHPGQPDTPRRRSPQPHRRHVTAAVALLLSGAAGTALTLTLTLGRENGTRSLGRPLTDHTDWALSAVFSPDGQIMVSSSRNGEVWMWDLTDRSAAKRLGHPLTGPRDGVTSLVFSPDGRILVGSGWDGTVWLWDLTDRYAPELVGRPLTGHTGPVWSVAFSMDGRTLASGGDDKTVRLWDMTNRVAPQQLTRLTDDTGYVTSVAFSSDDRILAGAGNGKNVLLWDIADRSAPRRLERSVAGPTVAFAAAFSPDGRALATGGSDGVIRLWDLAIPDDPRPVGRPLTGHTNRIWSLAFSPDGRTLASGGFDNSVRLWNVADRSNPKPRGGPLTGHTGWVLSVRFSPDSQVLASASSDHTVWLWSLP